jgi:hypothetical protein
MQIALKRVFKGSPKGKNHFYDILFHGLLTNEFTNSKANITHIFP